VERAPRQRAQRAPHDEFVQLVASFRGAAGDDADALYDEFCELLPGDRPTDGNTYKTYHSMEGGVNLGWSRLSAVPRFQPPPRRTQRLGTVQAFNRVTVHARVDGELQDIGFTEGRFVHAGDLLAQIDPRLFRAALDQARAKKAQLISAQKDLVRAKTLHTR
jgi:Biotin-lipoyl like